MTLQTLLRQYGITTIKKLTQRTGWSRQQCWSLWHGYDGVGKETALRLHDRLGIPLEDLLKVDPVPRRTPPHLSGRPRTTHTQEGPGHA
jgi:hypothetical protein